MIIDYDHNPAVSVDQKVQSLKESVQMALNESDSEHRIIRDLIANLKEAISNILSTPRVIEQGTSGMWTYRKWSNGTAECWGETSVTLTNYTTALGGYGYYTTISFPVGLFVSAPQITYSAQIGNGFSLTGSLMSLTKDDANLYAIASASGSQSTKWQIMTIGRWK